MLEEMPAGILTGWAQYFEIKTAMESGESLPQPTNTRTRKGYTHPDDARRWLGIFHQLDEKFNG